MQFAFSVAEKVGHSFASSSRTAISLHAVVNDLFGGLVRIQIKTALLGNYHDTPVQRRLGI